MNYREALQILGLRDPPSLTEVKKSYRSLALEHHPDRNPDNLHAADRFRLITEAYNCLTESSDQWTRNDKPLTAPPDEGRLKPRIEDTADVFDDIFGFTREDRILGFQSPQPLGLEADELAQGGKKKVRLFSYEKCPSCQGSGSEGLRLATICTYCFGAGRITTGLDKKKKICPKCGGRGRQVKKPCESCNGFGRIGKKRLQEVEVPKGLSEGAEYTLHALEVNTGRRLDVFIKIQLKKKFSLWG